MSDVQPQDGAPAESSVPQRVAELQRYAGWLGNNPDAARLRTSVGGLARALQNGDDLLNPLRRVQAHLDRLTAGGVTPLLRRSMRILRVELEASRS